MIDKCELASNGVYNVKFNSSPAVYHYRFNDVTILHECAWHDPAHCKVYINGQLRNDLTDILSFSDGNRTHWRLTFRNGYMWDYIHGSIVVTESCLKDSNAASAFGYLKRIAQTNELGRDEDKDGILASQYDDLRFIDSSLAAACYLNTDSNPLKHYPKPQLIFPFGCNSSQIKAVEKAFTDQISVIQGPPGTGKTQTILNIIANIVMQNKTVLVVSNNNSATANVLEKLNKYGIGFIVAPLGKKENKEAFIHNQSILPSDLKEWKSEFALQPVEDKLSKLIQIFEWQNNLAHCKQEFTDVTLEWEYFKADNNANVTDNVRKSLKSGDVMSLWLQLQTLAEENKDKSRGLFKRLISRVRWLLLNLRKRLCIAGGSIINEQNLVPQIIELQSLYYTVRLRELKELKEALERKLSQSNANEIIKVLTDDSLRILKHILSEKYTKLPRQTYNDVQDINRNTIEFNNQFPVILSTTFSARNSLKGHVYDYLIMDEASQVSVDTGCLALTCARNAVIVGDSLQLPNVITEQDKMKYDAIFRSFDIPHGFNSSENSFLQSVCSVISNVPQTLLREHYRCHPKIINFCNQRFYGGNLLIMTEDHNENNVLSAVMTVPGLHSRGQFNQREIDVIKQEVLPILADNADVGIITPYNAQVNAFTNQLPDIESATVHKYQGREKETIIMSTVDDYITPFSDDANLLNVAVSRAKKNFCIVLSGNEQERHGNIADLVDYILYNNFLVVHSKVCSVFDYLYEQYTEQRIAFLKGSKKISEYDSENLTFQLLQNILSEHSEFAHLRVLCHVPVRSIIRDTSMMSEEEKQYASHYSTHVDFLIINHVTKKPILVIETDGFNYHNSETEQHKRDVLKDSIFVKYEIPLVRLSTVGSGEEMKIINALNER